MNAAVDGPVVVVVLPFGYRDHGLAWPSRGGRSTETPRSQSGAPRSSVRHLLVFVHEDVPQRIPVRRCCCEIQLSRSIAPYAGSAVADTSATRTVGMICSQNPLMKRWNGLSAVLSAPTFHPGRHDAAASKRR
jgi:hypothetical protein